MNESCLLSHSLFIIENMMKQPEEEGHKIIHSAEPPVETDTVHFTKENDLQEIIIGEVFFHNAVLFNIGFLYCSTKGIRLYFYGDNCQT